MLLQIKTIGFEQLKHGFLFYFILLYLRQEFHISQADLQTLKVVKDNRELLILLPLLPEWLQA